MDVLPNSILHIDMEHLNVPRCHAIFFVNHWVFEVLMELRELVHVEFICSRDGNYPHSHGMWFDPVFEGGYYSIFSVGMGEYNTSTIVVV